MPNLTSVTVTAGVPTAGTGTVSTIDALMADGGQVSIGAIADAAVTAGATGSLSAKLRSISRDIVANIVLAAGSAIIGKVGIDQTTPGTTNLVQVPSTGHTGSATFTTGTTAYAASDVVGASAANAALDFGVVGISAGNILVTSVELEIDSATIISGETSYNLYLYNVTPPSAINDSSPFTLGAGDRASFLGKVSLPAVVVEGVTTATLYVRLDGINQHMLLAGTHLFGYLVSVGAFTPTARVYKITVHTVDL